MSVEIVAALCSNNGTEDATDSGDELYLEVCWEIPEACRARVTSFGWPLLSKTGEGKRVDFEIPGQCEEYEVGIG